MKNKKTKKAPVGILIELYNEGKAMQHNWIIDLVINGVVLELVIAGVIVNILYIHLDNLLLQFYVSFTVAVGFVYSILAVIQTFKFRRECNTLLKALEEEIKKRGGDIDERKNSKTSRKRNYRKSNQ